MIVIETMRIEGKNPTRRPTLLPKNLILLLPNLHTFVKKNIGDRYSNSLQLPVIPNDEQSEFEPATCQSPF